MRTYSIAQGMQCSVVTKRDIVYVWLIHFTVQQILTQHCKATKLQFFKEDSFGNLYEGENRLS